MGFADRELVEQVMARERQSHRQMGTLLVETGIIDSGQLAQALAERNSLDYVDLNLFEVDSGAANLIEATEARRYRAIPIAFLNDGSLLVVTPDPSNVLGADDIAIKTGYEVRRAIATPEGVEAVIGRLANTASFVPQIEDDVDRTEPDGSDVLAPAPLGPGSAGREARSRGDRRRGQSRRVGYPLRSASGRHARPISRGRCHGRLHDRAERSGRRTRLAHQDHGRPRHRRAPPSAGRPCRTRSRRPRDRHQDLHPPCDPRRVRRQRIP